MDGYSEVRRIQEAKEDISDHAYHISSFEYIVFSAKPQFTHLKIEILRQLKYYSTVAAEGKTFVLVFCVM